MMIEYGENCKFCKCSKCSFWKHCGIKAGNTQEYCEMDCCGECKPVKECYEFME